MKRKRLDQRALAGNLGSTIRGRVTAAPGYFGALELAGEVRRRFRPPATGGRATDPEWTTKRLIPFRQATLGRLQSLADEVSRIVEARVEPLQVAAILLERGLDGLSPDELAALLRRRQRRSA